MDTTALRQQKAARREAAHRKLSRSSLAILLASRMARRCRRLALTHFSLQAPQFFFTPVRREGLARPDDPWAASQRSRWGTCRRCRRIVLIREDFALGLVQSLPELVQSLPESSFILGGSRRGGIRFRKTLRVAVFRFCSVAVGIRGRDTRYRWNSPRLLRASVANQSRCLGFF